VEKHTISDIDFVKIILEHGGCIYPYYVDCDSKPKNFKCPLFKNCKGLRKSKEIEYSPKNAAEIYIMESQAARIKIWKNLK
jgi:hypothetical protein